MPINVAIAGASGFIGRALVPKILEKFPDVRITALSRGQGSTSDARIVWKPCDLFSLKSLEEAMPQSIDMAIYLVHSMGPTAQLDQGSFSDYDLILADNFARAVTKRSVGHVIYLGGLIPQAGKLSAHLESRLEVEQTFVSHKLPLTVFRAGLIVGEEGSSWQILTKLIRRLRVMVCPSWTQTLTTPTHLKQVVEAISEAAMNPSHIGKVYDLAGCRPLSYLEMMRLTAERMGKRRGFLKVPIFSPTLSRLWVTLVTNTPKTLVYPLIESLRHPMLARDTHRFPALNSDRPYSDLIRDVDVNYQSTRPILRFRPAGRTVRSVQRLPLPKGKDAAWIKDEYLRWLPTFLNPIPLVNVAIDGSRVAISLFTERFVLLELNFSPERSNADRQLLYIKSGALVHKNNVGRLEFRVVLDRRYVLAAIHQYTPALPWYFYRFTQARLHLWIMRAFGRWLERSL